MVLLELLNDTASGTIMSIDVFFRMNYADDRNTYRSQRFHSTLCPNNAFRQIQIFRELNGLEFRGLETHVHTHNCVGYVPNLPRSTGAIDWSSNTLAPTHARTKFVRTVSA